MVSAPSVVESKKKAVLYAMHPFFLDTLTLPMQNSGILAKAGLLQQLLHQGFGGLLVGAEEMDVGLFGDLQ